MSGSLDGGYTDEFINNFKHTKQMKNNNDLFDLVDIIKSDKRLIRIFKVELVKRKNFDLAAKFRDAEKKNIEDSLQSELEKKIHTFATISGISFKRKHFIRWLWRNKDEIWSDGYISKTLTGLVNKGVLQRDNENYYKLY